MKLIYDPTSTSSRIASFFLFDQNVEFEEQIISIADGEQYTAEFSGINANAQVPVLVDGDFTVAQSSAIIRYVALKYEMPVYPAELQARTRVDEAISWFQTNFHVFHCVLLSYTHILPPLLALEAKTLAAMRAIGAQGSRKYLQVLNDRMIGDGDFVCGSEITLADYVGAANVTLGAFADVDLSAFPNVLRWLATLRERRGWNLAYGDFERAVAARQRPAAA